jgi:protein-disulfide isomerase
MPRRTLGLFLRLVLAVFTANCRSKHDQGASIGLAGECRELRDALCASVGPNTDQCVAFTRQVTQYKLETCKALLKEAAPLGRGFPAPDPSAEEAVVARLPPEVQAELVAGPVPSFGNESAEVTLVEFSDFECPFCANAANVIHRLRDEYASKVRFLFREYPLPNHAHARGAAEAALAAFEQGKFWEYHDRLFQNQQSLDRAGLEAHAAALGLDLPRFGLTRDQSRTAERVDADIALGDKVQVPGTPTMFVNGQNVVDPADYLAIKRVIDVALTAAEKH